MSDGGRSDDASLTNGGENVRRGDDANPTNGCENAHCGDDANIRPNDCACVRLSDDAP